MQPSQLKLLLDPFAGGGAIPLESLRLGLETYCSDLNPVAVLTEKATCEYFQKFNGKLAEELNKWRKILGKKFIKAIKPYYQNPINTNKIYGFFWARQIKCPNSNCKALIPMLTNCTFVNKEFQRNRKKIKKIIALKPIISGESGEKKIDFILQKDDEIDFDHSNLIIYSSGKVTCPSCEFTIDNQDVMNKVKSKIYEDRLLIVMEKDSDNKKIYRLSTEQDLNLYEKVKEELKKYDDFIPNEELPMEVRRWQVQNYGILNWNEFFNKRQILTSMIYLEKLREVKNEIIKNVEYSKELSSAIIVYLYHA